MEDLEVPEKIKPDPNKEKKAKMIDEIPKELRNEFDIPDPEKWTASSLTSSISRGMICN